MTSVNPQQSRGFTLVELMVSIALVLLLVIGINGVFRITTDTIGAGQALSESVANNRAVQSVLYNDFAQSVIRSDDMPAFVIRSSVTSAFLDREDELSDADYAALYGAGTPTRADVDQAIRTVDLDGDNTENTTDFPTGERIPRNNLSRRNHRIDLMSFFVRHLYPRQTGGGVDQATNTYRDEYVSDMTSNEAWVWYGILNQPQDPFDPAPNAMEPGWNSGNPTPMRPIPGNTGTNNPNNFYARQWGLGRMAVLLREPNPATGRIDDKTGNRQYYVRRVVGPSPAAPSSTAPLSPTAGNTSTGTDTLPDQTYLLRHSRLDLAGTSIDGYRRLLSVDPLATPPYSVIREATAAPDPKWYDGAHISFRFSGYPFPNNPLTSASVARTTPWLVGGCTQFIVEYAGDFLRQNNNTASTSYGAITDTYRDDILNPPTPDAVAGAGTDGVIDYYVDANGNQQTRWYGFPRDVSGTTVATLGLPDGVITTTANSPDVRPLRDSLAGGVPAAFEHITGMANYANPALDSQYICAWAPIYPDPTSSATAQNPASDLPTPPKPLLLRVTMTIDDPTGRLPEGQTYEYVIELP